MFKIKIHLTCLCAAMITLATHAVDQDLVPARVDVSAAVVKAINEPWLKPDERRDMRIRHGSGPMKI